MMDGAVCLDWEDPDRIRLSMAKCPAQPQQIRPMSASCVPPRNSLFGYHRGRICEPNGECRL
jgi:hypothetical protein